MPVFIIRIFKGICVCVCRRVHVFLRSFFMLNAQHLMFLFYNILAGAIVAWHRDRAFGALGFGVRTCVCLLRSLP